MQGVHEAKAALRRELLARRASLDPLVRETETAAATAHLLAAVPLAAGDVVASYESFGTEPATARLHRALRRSGCRLLLPVTLADHDLAWRDDDGAVLPVAAIASCSLVVVPGLAAARDGCRLGRGGGSYDRALARVPDGVPRVWIGYAHELLEALPREPHDVPVTHAATATGMVALGP